MITAEEIIDIMLGMRDGKQSQILSRFFKTGRGEYGEGDRFLGLRVPQTRSIVKEARLDVPFDEIRKMLYSPWHEVRLCGFLLLVEEMKNALPKRTRKKGVDTVETGKMLARRRTEVAGFYLLHAKRANNWDLVDLSAGYILGEWLLHPLENGNMPSRQILDELAESCDLWEQRIAIVSTIALIKNNQFDDTVRVAVKLLHHPHDLIHKAVGWMLREVGKRDVEVLRSFLSRYHKSMSRTTLRYAIERMGEEERKMWMRK